jgi:hypothetical protein
MSKAKGPSQSAITGMQHAMTHDFPNEDLSQTGEAAGWPKGLFGPESSKKLIAEGIRTFTQLRAAVKSRTKEEFYRDFGTHDGQVGALAKAANTMWEVVTTWELAYEMKQTREPKGAGAMTTDGWLMHADSHLMPAEDLKLGAAGGWPDGAMGPRRIEKLREEGITTTSQLMGVALSLSYDQFVARFGGREGSLDSRAGGFYGFLHRSYANQMS